MIRLVISDLRHHATTWIGAFIIAVGCGYIGGWVASLMTTAGYYAGDAGLYKSLQNAGSMMLVFSLIAGIAVLVLAANLTVSVQQRSYALWQLANVRPWLVSVVVFVQLAVVAIFGAFSGTLLATITINPLFHLVFGARETYAQVVPHIDLSLTPIVWIAVAGVFICGGLRGALSAGRTPALIVLREPEPKRMKMSWLRLLLFAALVASIIGVYLSMTDSKPDEAMAWSILMPILVVAALATIAPLTFSALLGLWTAVVPQKRWNAWYLARHTARYGLSSSTSIETPIMVSFGLTAGLFSVIQVLAAYAQSLGATDTSGFFLDSATTLVMLGGPVLLCAIGAAVSVVMSSRSRSRDIALLNANGADPKTQIAAAVCEAFMHTVTASLAGMLSVVVSSALVALALRLPLFIGLSFGAGFIVSLVGFALVLVATLVPTITALNQDTVSALEV